MHVFEEVLYSKRSFEEFLANERTYQLPTAIILLFVTLSIYAISFTKPITRTG
jgi:hypothetical protein